jgi:hypothetical protein
MADSSVRVRVGRWGKNRSRVGILGTSGMSCAMVYMRERVVGANNKLAWGRNRGIYINICVYIGTSQG